MPTVVIGDNTGDDYSGTEDVQMKEGQATTNQNGSNLEITKYTANDHNHTLLKFTGISSLPSSLTVSSAVISIYSGATNVGGVTANAKRVLRNWAEGTATWNTYDGSNSWTTAGCLSNGNDRSGTNSTTATTATSSATWTNFSDDAQVQADVEDFADGTLSNYGWHLERNDAGEDFYYNVYEDSEGPDGDRPYLTVTYTATGGGATGKSNPLFGPLSGPLAGGIGI